MGKSYINLKNMNTFFVLNKWPLEVMGKLLVTAISRFIWL